jgi:hypothetical protein
MIILHEAPPATEQIASLVRNDDQPSIQAWTSIANRFGYQRTLKKNVPDQKPGTSLRVYVIGLFFNQLHN